MLEMTKEAVPSDNNLKADGNTELAIPGSNERKCNDAQPCLDTDSLRRFSQVWGEVGRAILGRRSSVKV
jgi:hypothetical protein